MPTALVTGITGQDGGYLAERLVADGFVVHGLVAREQGDGLADLRSRSPQVVLHEGDLRDEASLASVVRAVDPDEVYNLAGVSSVAFSWEQPVLTADVTALGAARLLEQVWQQAERRGAPIRFLQASSAEIFGAAPPPQDETTAIAPTSPYGAAKAYAHLLVGVYRQRGLPAASAVLYNHESPRRPPSFVTRKITQSAARIARGMQEELVLGSLDVQRDWGWAPDYVDAMVRINRHDPPDDVVVATGEAHTVREFVAAAFRRAGVEDWERLVRVDPRFVRPNDAPVLRGDWGKAARELGWAPTVGFEELVCRMVDSDLALLDTPDPQAPAAAPRTSW